MNHYNLSISGRVQNVGFRASARDKAMEFGVTGFVENLSNGKVYIEAEGSEEALGDFIAWCRQGPSFAFVEDVDIKDGAVKNFNLFEIKH